MNFSNAVFIKSAASERQFIDDGKPKIVFAGRSNVGKSSIINALCFKKKLANVGNTPGKTSHVNYFLVDDLFYFVDLPGYGYAKRSFSEKERWAELIEGYFQKTKIDLGILVLDIRREPSELDIQMAGYFEETNIPWLIVMNKIDKISPSAMDKAAAEAVSGLSESVKRFPFTCTKRSGAEALRKEIIEFLQEK